MLTLQQNNNRTDVKIYCIEDLVPRKHILRKIDRVIDFNFIYPLVEPLYCTDNGRPSIDPVVLFKIVLIQYLFGIRSMRQTIREIEVNIAYRWFLGYSLDDRIPHFTTFGKNYERRFKDTDIFENIFQHILAEAIKKGFVDPKAVFVDSTHV
ncbi:MAG: transposase, partial [Proteocatella sp.]